MRIDAKLRLIDRAAIRFIVAAETGFRPAESEHSMLHLGVLPRVYANNLEAIGEPDPGAARPRTARARPYYPTVAGEEPAKIRRRYQSRRRAERARGHWHRSG